MQAFSQSNKTINIPDPLKAGENDGWLLQGRFNLQKK